jgi:hypothetical protein
MYLKVRDSANESWNYIGNITRVVASDVERMDALTSDEAIEMVNERVDAINPDVLVMDEQYLGRGNFMVVTCVTASIPGSPSVEYNVLFNTCGFLCSDHGDTMDRFIVNR